MEPSDFIYTDNFPTLTLSQVQGGIDAVEAYWYGALQFWGGLPVDIRNKKRTLLENLLVGWWLADLYPGAVTGIIANGGMPVSSKTIGGTSITFCETTGGVGLDSLKSNTFGLLALEMILAAEELYAVYG